MLKLGQSRIGNEDDARRFAEEALAGFEGGRALVSGDGGAALVAGAARSRCSSVTARKSRCGGWSCRFACAKRSRA